MSSETLAELYKARTERDRARNALTKIRGIVVAHGKGIGSYETAMAAIASILHVKAPRSSR